MRELVTLAQARAHLRSDSTRDDADLTLKIQAASEAVLDHLGSGATFLGEDGSVSGDIPAKVQMATLLTIGWLYTERTGEHSKAMSAESRDPLPRAAVALLQSLRPVIV